jgi:hypothetical protein
MVDPKKAASTLNDDKKESFASKTTKQSLRVANETVKITKSRLTVGCRYVIDKRKIQNEDYRVISEIFFLFFEKSKVEIF